MQFLDRNSPRSHLSFQHHLQLLPISKPHSIFTFPGFPSLVLFMFVTAPSWLNTAQRSSPQLVERHSGRAAGQGYCPVVTASAHNLWTTAWQAKWEGEGNVVLLHLAIWGLWVSLSISIFQRPNVSSTATTRPRAGRGGVGWGGAVGVVEDKAISAQPTELELDWAGLSLAKRK